MQNAGDLRKAIDTFLVQPKRILGADAPQRWEQGWGDLERKIILPIEMDGESTGFKVQISSLSDDGGKQFRIGLMAPFCISRLDHTSEIHQNTLALPEEDLPFLVRGPHYLSWLLNRRFFRSVNEPPRLRNARPFFTNQRSFDSILRWFLGEHGIESLSANHAVTLPNRDWLF